MAFAPHHYLDSINVKENLTRQTTNYKTFYFDNSINKTKEEHR